MCVFTCKCYRRPEDVDYSTHVLTHSCKQLNESARNKIWIHFKRRKIPYPLSHLSSLKDHFENSKINALLIILYSSYKR